MFSILVFSKTWAGRDPIRCCEAHLPITGHRKYRNIGAISYVYADMSGSAVGWPVCSGTLSGDSAVVLAEGSICTTGGTVTLGFGTGLLVSLNSNNAAQTNAVRERAVSSASTLHTICRWAAHRRTLPGGGLKLLYISVPPFVRVDGFNRRSHTY